MWAGSTNGLSATDRVFTDDNPADIDNPTPDSALHRNVDLVVLKADEEGEFHHYYIRVTNDSPYNDRTQSFRLREDTYRDA